VEDFGGHAEVIVSFWSHVGGVGGGTHSLLRRRCRFFLPLLMVLCLHVFLRR
jgi:hypothetical protein